MRDPSKLKVDTSQRPGIHIIQGDLRQIEEHASLLSTIDTAILIATSWGDPQECIDINVTANLTLIGLLDPDRVRQVIYFSTASILDRSNQPLQEAGDIGTDYIRTKYICHQKLSDVAISNQLTTVFPTLVFGGEANKPYSHISAGLGEVANWINLIRFFKADGSFHFIHAKDIATVITYLVENPTGQPREMVLGNAAMTANQTIEAASHYLGKRIFFRIPLSLGLANLLIKVFKVQMADWDRFCLQYRHFTYKNPVNPETFGFQPFCATVAELFQATGVEPH